MAIAILPDDTSFLHDTPQRIGAAYIRISRPDPHDRSYSPDSQEASCLAAAMRDGVYIPPEYIFRDKYTGMSLDRPDLKKLRALLPDPKFTDLYVHDIDRLARKLALQLLLKDECEQFGVTFHDVAMPLDTQTPTGQLFANIKGVFAEYERLLILERTTRGRLQRVKEGFVPPGAVPLGYIYVKNPFPEKGAHYEINEEEAALVRRIFDMYVKEGMSLFAIAKQLTAEGIPTHSDRRTGGPTRKLRAGIWHPGVISYMLHTEAYVGTLYYGKKERIAGKKDPEKKTRWRLRPREEWFMVPVPRIIDDDIFEKAQIVPERNAKYSRRNQKHDYLLGGALLKCGKCRSVMSGIFRPENSSRYYRCTQHSRRYQVEEPCGRSIWANKIEERVWAALVKALQKPSTLLKITTRRDKKTGVMQTALDRDREAFERQLAQCAKNLKKWEKAFEDDVIDQEDFRRKRTEILAHRDGVTQELARLEDEQRRIQQFAQETITLNEVCKGFRKGIHTFDMAQKKRTLEALTVTVVLEEDGSITVDGSIPMRIASNTVSNAVNCIRGNLPFSLIA